ncbi:TetR/AcrR family transcriptional regulator [Bacillus taeanensis]|uniref:TetR/AcrR family transcriptional regulator n=1 Tax=Bacillus taeanensis TaxID=273032 RepID=A0A366XR08_9BACI|nr:TetR/AcrR family transcriptional regulator [Bacillus taeanensis]RBW68770.1 TetR/AcrR family transcriptional regulator [Bacillus taeanensis]
MNEKKKAIVETAINLFAQKGFSSTSVQEIASEAGISKGAFYLHFKSKDALLLAILNYYSETIREKVSAIDNKPLAPKEKFTQQLTVLIETLVKHKEFLIMQSREQAIPLNEDVKKLIFKMHRETHTLYQTKLTAIYGDKITPYLWDLSTLLEGMFQSYLKLMLFNNQAFQFEEVAAFLLNRIDNIVQFFLKGKEEPLLTEAKVKDIQAQFQQFFMSNQDTIENILTNMKKEIATMGDREDLTVSLEVLEGEISSDKPRTAVIQGMLSNFKNIPAFEKYILQIKAKYKLNV